MSKSLATSYSSCRKQIRRACFALSVLTVLPAAGAVAAADDPPLRRSERLDLRRLGKVSEDERAVLRIEWRVGLSGAEEAHSVQDILDNLRRIEQTMAAISQLVRNMPAKKPATPVAAEPAASDDQGMRLMLANIAAVCLVTLWLFRRRKSARTSAAREVGPLEHSPSVADPAGAASTPMARSIAAGQDTQATPSVHTGEPAARIESRVPTESTAATSAPTPAAQPEIEEPIASPLSATSEPPATESPAIAFSLEEDPEGEARAKARIPVPRSQSKDPRVPERRQEIEVEPTLQLAEIMLSMGLEQGAAQALVEYTEANPRDALYHWLKLLGIYRKRGLHQEFRAAAENLRKNFNIQAQYLQKSHTGEMPTLENFARVAEHVQEIWTRHDECIGYLGRLLEDNRDGERAGFPQSVAEEILLLIEILKALRSGGVQAAAT